MSSPQPSWTAEYKEFADKLKAWPGDIPNMNERVLGQYLADAPAFRNCHYLFWTSEGARFLITFRTDRIPITEEILPMMELLFEDGPVHEVGQTRFSREFCQGSYTEKTVSDSIADGLMSAAEKDSNADAFDFSRTDTGKRLLRSRRNGSS